MRRIFTLLFVFYCIFSFFSGHAQDARFAQFYATPLQLNPAMIGVYEGQFRVAANYRELYSSILARDPYRTIAASFDFRYRVLNGDYLGFGFSALKDEVGIANFSRLQGNFGASFMKQLGGSRYSYTDQYLIAGTQIGLGQRGFDWEKLWFSQQFDEANASINFGADSGEMFEQRNTNVYLDLNVGILWYALFDENRSIYFGGALHHFNTPNISLMEDAQENLYTKWIVHGGGELPFNDNLSLLPAAAVMSQGPSFSTTAGANFRYTNRDWRELAIRMGAWAHVANKLDSGVALDAIIITAILEVERWNIGISYDMTSSSLKQANNSRGAFELSLIYTHPEKARSKTKCPKF